MRPLKFRVWDKEYKDWLAQDTFAISDKGDVLTYRSGGLLGPTWLLENNSEIFIIQQFTGLLDKNGKEIYEGDIITVNNFYIKSGKQVSDEIIFSKGSFITKKREKSIYYENDFMGKPWSVIIGNIFENKELLTQIDK